MTREEAINVLENPDVSIGVAARIGQDPEYWRKLKPALDMAISALRQQETVTNRNGLKVVEIDQVKPLTLDELRQMDGEPVWVEFQDGSGGCWGLVHITMFNHVVFAHVVFANGLYCTVGKPYFGKTWLTYRQKPEEGTV